MGKIKEVSFFSVKNDYDMVNSYTHRYIYIYIFCICTHYRLPFIMIRITHT